LTNYTTFATNAGSNTNCYLPSDQFTSLQTNEDPKAGYYNAVSGHTPSPYLGEGLNPNYCKVISGNNAFSDFGGLYNTEFIVGLNKPKMYACNAAYSYNDGISNIQ
jgi:hypothetical protein